MTAQEMAEIIKKETIEAYDWLNVVKDDLRDNKSSVVYQRALRTWAVLDRLCMMLGIEY